MMWLNIDDIHPNWNFSRDKLLPYSGRCGDGIDLMLVDYWKRVFNTTSDLR